MNVTTGEIKHFDGEMFDKKKWIELDSDREQLLLGMNRKQRRKYLKKNGMFSKGKWGWR